MSAPSQVGNSQPCELTEVYMDVEMLVVVDTRVSVVVSRSVVVIGMVVYSVVGV